MTFTNKHASLLAMLGLITLLLGTLPAIWRGGLA